MASDDDLVSLGPWPGGVNNREADHRIPAGQCRDAKDVTIRGDGSVTLRDGFDNKDTTAMHSLWPQTPQPGIDFMLGVRGSTLVKVTRSAAGALVFTNLRTGMAGKEFPLAYACVDGVVYYGNGIVSGRVVNGSHYAWGVELPDTDPTLTAASTGGLNAGRYQVTCTYIDALGEESGARAGVVVDVAQGGGIAVSAIPQPADGNVSYVCVYATEANGSVFYLHRRLAVGTTSTTVGISATSGRRLMTQFLVPPPAPYLLEVHSGRIYGVDLDYPKMPWFTEPLRFGLMKAGNRLAFEGEVDMMLSVDAGLFIAADATYFLPGGDPKAFAPRDVFPFGAVRYAATHRPDDNTVLWRPKNGVLCIGAPDGSAVHVTEDRVVTKIDAAKGAIAYHQQDGTKQVITVAATGLESELEAESYMEVSQINQKSFDSAGHAGCTFSAEVINP